MMEIYVKRINSNKQDINKQDINKQEVNNEEVSEQWLYQSNGELLRVEHMNFDVIEEADFLLTQNQKEGYLYLRGIDTKGIINQLLISYGEVDYEEIIILVQKYLMYSDVFFDAFNKSFIPNDSVEGFAFSYTTIRDSNIRLPEKRINKEYALPIVVGVNDFNTQELLAAGLYGFTNINIVLSDKFIEGLDTMHTVFITEDVKHLKSELSKLKVRKKIMFASKLIAVIASITGFVVIGLSFIKKLRKKV